MVAGLSKEFVGDEIWNVVMQTVGEIREGWRIGKRREMWARGEIEVL